MKGLGLYIHIPFCKSKCLYCDFNSYSGKDIMQDSYIHCLIKEIELQSSKISGRGIESIYIGGGTPTYLNFNSLKKLLKCLERYASPGMEISCEANPGALSKEKLQLLKDYGINRLSIGLQSWNDNILKKLGRVHTVKDFIENYNCARLLGFSNINVDLMFSIYGQTIDDFEDTLNNVINIQPEHISCYSLIIEEGTPIWAKRECGEWKEADEETDRQMYELATYKLTNAGFKRYEISNYAKHGFECRHNIIYWKCQNYIGVGAGAHSYIDGVRYSNETDIEKYIDDIYVGRLPEVQRENLSLKDSMAEFMFMGLRMMEGINTAEFVSRFDRSIYDIYGTAIEKMIKNGLLNVRENCIRLTDRGIDLSNQVFMEFI